MGRSSCGRARRWGSSQAHGWADREATWLEALHLQALQRRYDALLDLGPAGEAAAELEGLVRIHPLDERFWAHLMLALYRSGRQADAIRAYQQARRHLVDELGIEPGAELVELEHRILDHDLTLVAPLDPIALTSAANPGPEQGHAQSSPLLFTDIEEHAPVGRLPRRDAGCARAPRALLDEAVARHGGEGMVKRTGDGVDAAFFDTQHCAPRPPSTLSSHWSEQHGRPRRRAATGWRSTSARSSSAPATYFAIPQHGCSVAGFRSRRSRSCCRLPRIQEVEDQVPDDVRLVSLGVHRLRESPASTASTVLPPRPASALPLPHPGRAAAVAVPASSYRGRDEGLLCAEHLGPARPGTVTLVRPGGVGETRLRSRWPPRPGHRFRDGVRIVDLRRSAPRPCPPRWRPRWGWPGGGAAFVPLEGILDWVTRRYTLLVVGNCEHVLAAVGPLVAR